MRPAQDRLTGISTTTTAQPSAGGTRQAQDPAADMPHAAAAPVSALPSRAAGKPSPVRAPRPKAGEGTSSSPRRERAAQGIPGPATGEADPGSSPASPVRARAQTPAGGELPSNSPPAGSTGRTYAVALPAGMELLSLNDRLHWSERARRSQALKEAAWALARQAKIPPLSRVAVVAEYQPPDRRRRDSDNIAVSVKAAIDGCVIAGCLPGDDSPRYVESVTCRIGEPYPKGRLVLHLIEVAERPGAA